MDSMVSAVPSSWRKMEGAVQSLQNTLLVIYVVAVFLWAVFLFFTFAGRFDIGALAIAILTLALANAFYALHQFCEGAMERVRQLGAMV